MVTAQKNRVILLLILLLSLFGAPSPAETGPGAPSASAIKETECVILLHGLGRNRFSMKRIATRLEHLGYKVWNRGYPSTEKPVQNLVADHVLPAVRWAESLGATKIHFVTHSLGGILVRAYLQENTLPAGSRIVMLAPPNKGSEVADRLKPFFLYRRLMGPAGQQLGTTPDSIPNRLEPVVADIGVIAGTRSMEPWFSLIIPGPDDGKVSVENTTLSEMHDFLTVKCTHPFIMLSPEVINQVVSYLQDGRFFRQ